ncbi:small multidrug resistance protein [Paenibacillus vortex V453]|jgi:paired small multidrug resistance pump|uniref:Small multidrug resistance protein n=1 Tax=Paenibacillus vortex V453 TaxID=715225 RepID=A0A2R9SL46_9BACL|nr:MULTISPECIES: multidrug efflux SMR transporter [Paenibacillus]ANA79840.1 multidrug resistance protein SMR [Paenibacillus glucanolyticus]AVV56135.1 QacE family quaternary ammonium compound efflux SMR transporter [Paenibacillus glucanolyticus]AWP30672.1 QacE family quaternary ammonium compound efflux SMR transporter [Paenibacillus sp. Cedars]EFU38077.1 small multidrug resistance protein [Paenibacillus vortex V453]ETT38218.1 small multidrug resistance protein [Paenibacillus sp. FSL R5-808]
MNRNWIYVLLAGLVEVIWVMGLKYSNNTLEWLGTIVAITASFYLIIEAAKRLPVGTVYAVFTGIGTAGTVASEMLFFGEPFKLVKVLLICVLLAGVVGLKLVTSDHAEPEVSK